MQLLYLVPPALMLWRSFSDSSTAIVLITPVVVMAAGQLSGGLAWLTISGEDAADLVTTAPLSASRVIRAKIEVVLIAIGVLFAPLVGALALASPLRAAVTATGVAIATISATAIQLWFRVQARRGGGVRRRQTSSRLCDLHPEAFLVDRLGRDRRAGAVDPHRGRHHRTYDLGHRRGDLEDQPATGVVGGGPQFGATPSSLHHSGRKRFGRFLRQVMTHGRDHAMDAAAGELRGGRSAIGRGDDAVGIAVQRDGGYADRREFREPALQLSIVRIARGQTEAMAIALDHDIDVVRIVMRHRGPLERRLVEMPVRRPLLP